MKTKYLLIILFLLLPFAYADSESIELKANVISPTSVNTEASGDVECENNKIIETIIILIIAYIISFLLYYLGVKMKCPKYCPHCGSKVKNLEEEFTQLKQEAKEIKEESKRLFFF